MTFGLFMYLHSFLKNYLIDEGIHVFGDYFFVYFLKFKIVVRSSMIEIHLNGSKNIFYAINNSKDMVNFCLIVTNLSQQIRLSML